MSKDNCADLKKYKDTIRSSDSRIATLTGEKNQLLKQLKQKCGTSDVEDAKVILKTKRESLTELEGVADGLLEKASSMAEKLEVWSDGEAD